MDFLYLLRVLTKRKWIILGAAMLAALIAFILTKNDSNQYRSTAQISTGFTVSDEVRVNSASYSFYEAETKFNNAIVTITSPTVISLVAYKLILHDLTSAEPFVKLTEDGKNSRVYKAVNKDQAIAIFNNKLDEMQLLSSFKPEEKKLLEFLKLYGYDYKNISENLKVFRYERSDYIQMDYLSPNPELSAFAVNTAYEQFMRFNKSIRSIRSQESIDTLRSIMEKKKQDVDVRNALLKQKGVSLDPEMNLSAMGIVGELEKSLAQEKAILTQKQYDWRKVNQRLANYKEPATATRPDNANNDEVVIAREAWRAAYKDWKANPSDKDLENRYKQLQADYQSKYLNSNAALKATTSKQGVTREDLEDQKMDIELDIQATNSNIAALNSKIGMLRGEVNSSISKSATIETLIKERDQANKEYLDAKEKYSEATDMGGSTANNFKQVLMGQPAIEPEPSKRKMIIALAGAAALITTALIIILLAYLDSSIKTPVIFSKSVGLRLISMINFMNLKDKNIPDIIAHKTAESNDIEIKRNNIFRESLRKLRFEIERSGKKVFLFTSTQKGQGKTTIIQALSYSMSLSKKKILIIDTNFCNNDLTQQLHAEPILEKLLPYRTDDKALVEQVKVFSKDVGLGSVFAIGSEGGDYTPSEILPKENLLKHLQSLTTEFDFIFLEGPPLNDFSDSRELSEYVDGVIAVFSANHIMKQTDKESIAFFKELNGKFCGSILNMVDLENVNVA